MGKRWAEVARTWSVALAIVAAVAAASSRTVPGHAASHPSPAPVAFAPGAPGAAAPFDVQAIVRRAHFAFREENGRFTGGHSTYEVESGAGRLSVRPVQREQVKVKMGAPLVLATSIRRGAAAVPVAESRVVDGEGRLIRGGPAVQEILENKDDGVELSWRWPEAPPGDGDLEVRVSASGLAYVEETAGGLHFRDGASPLGIRFGHATWVDANGRRAEVPSQWDGRDIVMKVPRDVVDGASYPAVLDPLLGPEAGVDAPVFGAASGPQFSATTAFDPASGTHLVAWIDGRASAFTQAFSTRVDSSGVVLDPNGIPVSAFGSNADEAFAVYDGTNFLVVYSSYPNVMGRRIGPDGTLVDAAPFVINSDPNQKFSIGAASNGATTLVVWQDGRNSATTGGDIYGTRVQGASILDGVSTGFPISTATGYQNEPKVTFGSGNWLVVWTDFRSGTNTDVYGARVSGAGAVIETAGIPISTVTGGKGAPWPASDGSGYFVVWDDARNFSNDVYGARVTASGVVADPGGFAICTDGSYQSKASVAFAGTNYQVVWEDTRFGLYGNRVVPSTGALLDGPGGAAIPGFAGSYASEPRVFAAGSGFYLAWGQRQPNDSPGDVFGSRLTTAAALLDAPGVTLARSGNGELSPAVAADGTNYFVAWKDDRGSTTNVFGARVSGTTGASLDPAGILLSPGGLDKNAPAVAFNGTQYLVVWKEAGPPSGIYGTRVSTTGTIVGSARTALFTGSPNQPQRDIAVASDGAGWLVVWYDGRNFGTNSNDVYGGRVTAAGAVSDPSGIPIAAVPQSQDNPRVGYGGGNYFVTWTDFRSGSRYDLYGARVTSAGTVLDPAGLPLSVGTGVASVDFSSHGIAYAAPNFVAAYTRSQALRRVRITAATGAVVDDALLTGCCVSGAAITYDLDTFLVLFNRFSPPGYLLQGTRVSTAGADLDPTDWSVATGTNRGPSLAALGVSGKALAAYSRYDATSGVTSDRIRTRLLTRAQSDLAATKTDGQTTAVPGGTVTYTMTVSNAGPDAAVGATVTDTVPGTLSSVTWTCVGAGGGVCPANGTGSIAHTVDVPSGGSVTYTLAGTISPSATGSLANTITVTAPAGWTEPNTANNSATDTDTLTPQANLAITKTDGGTTTAPGAAIAYIIVASNAGPSAVTGATVTDTFPAGTTAISWTCAGSGGGTCAASGAGNISQLVNLPVGGSVTFTVNATVSATAVGTWSNTATVAAPGGVTDPTPGNNSATDTDTVLPPNNTPAGAKPMLVGSTSSDLIGPVPNDQNWFRFGARAGRSYCVEVDNGKSDTSDRDPILDVYRADGITLIGSNDDIAGGPDGGRLSRLCFIAPASEDNLARVTGGTNGSPGGIRVRVVETTLFCPWFGPLFSGSGFETFILIKNTTGIAHSATVTLTDASGATMGSPQTGTAPANGSYNLQVSAPPPTGFGLSGVSGGMWIAHDGPPGGMIANVTTLNFGSGVSYDTPAVPRLDNRP